MSSQPRTSRHRWGTVPTHQDTHALNQARPARTLGACASKYTQQLTRVNPLATSDGGGPTVYQRGGRSCGRQKRMQPATPFSPQRQHPPEASSQTVLLAAGLSPLPQAMQVAFTPPTDTSLVPHSWHLPSTTPYPGSQLAGPVRGAGAMRAWRKGDRPEVGQGPAPERAAMGPGRQGRQGGKTLHSGVRILMSQGKKPGPKVAGAGPLAYTHIDG